MTRKNEREKKGETKESYQEKLDECLIKQKFIPKWKSNRFLIVRYVTTGNLNSFGYFNECEYNNIKFKCHRYCQSLTTNNSN